MTVTLIGSRAMKHWYPDAREPKGDWDWHADGPSVSAIGMPERSQARNDVFIDERLGGWPWGSIATPDELYTLKISHSFWEINGPRNWDKHASDVVFLERKGARFLRPLYDIVLPIWKERYKRNPTNLNQTAGEFFADAVPRVYDHDSIHETIAYGDEPLYMSILRDGSEVAVDNTKFWAMCHDAQIKCVREEIYATALERILIPKGYKGSPGAAYHWALRRTATSLFKGEWALFLMLNLDELTKPDTEYLHKHIVNRHMLRMIGEKNV